MTTKSGRIASVRLAAVKVAGQGTWTLGGFTREVIEEDSWDLDIKKKYFSVGDAGTLTFSGLYDLQAVAETTDQNLLNSACQNSSLLTGGDLRFYVDNTSYWTVDTGHNILITKCKSITMEKSAMGTVDFEATISGGHMILL